MESHTDIICQFLVGIETPHLIDLLIQQKIELRGVDCQNRPCPCSITDAELTQMLPEKHLWIILKDSITSQQLWLDHAYELMNAAQHAGVSYLTIGHYSGQTEIKSLYSRIDCTRPDVRIDA